MLESGIKRIELWDLRNPQENVFLLARVLIPSGSTGHSCQKYTNKLRRLLIG